MADRVKYFLLGLLFLVVAGVIAFDKWNSVAEPLGAGEERARDERRGVVAVGADPLPAEPPPAVIEPAPVTPKPEPLVVAPPAVEPEPVPLPPPPAPKPKPAPERDRTHVVKKGESLEAIALRYYNSRRGIAWIVEANDLDNANFIRVNQKLVIPARGEMRKPERTKTRDVPERYIVRSGDGDLYAICRRFYGTSGEGARVARVMELNSLWSADVKAGTELRLPPK